MGFVPPNESKRLRAVRRYDVLNTPQPRLVAG